MQRVSGLQKDVFALYRALLRSARKKDNESRDLYKFVRNEFRTKALNISRTDFKLIEHSLRHGYKQKKLLEMPGTSFAQATTARHSTEPSGTDSK